MGEFELAVAMIEIWIQDITNALKPDATPVERGCGYLSAVRILEDSFDCIDIPDYYFKLAKQIVRRGYKPEEIEEAHKITYGKHDWQGLENENCIRCGRKKASWRKIFLPQEVSRNWRTALPENHIPLCSTCAKSIDYRSVRFILGEWVWQARFRSLRRFFAEKPYDWDDRLEYPLWPAEYGEDYWSGGGKIQHAAYSRPPALCIPLDQRIAETDRLLNPNQPALFSLTPLA